MANTRFQLKRSVVSGVTPTTSDIATGELGVNLRDKKLFTSNGSAVFELGSNLTSLAVGNSTATQIVNTTGIFVNGGITLTRNDTTLGFTTTSGASVGMRQQSDDNFVFYTTNTTGGSRAVFNVYANTNAPNQNSAFRFNGPIDMGSAGIYANNSLGSSGQVLASNGTSVYWSSVGGTGTVTSVGTGAGLSGGPITGSGTISVVANNGVAANSSGVFVVQGTGTVVNSTGVHVNTAYVGTLAANSASFLGGNSASDLRTYSEQLAGNAYSNAVANAAALYQTTAGLSANVATLTANAAGFLGNSSGTLANIASWATGNAATAYANAISYANAAAANAYSNAVANAAALYQTTAGLSANVATLTANAAGFLGNSSGTLANIASWATGNAATAYTNATSYADTKANAAYSNGVSYTDTKAGEAYSNAASYASNVASQAYSNAVANAAALYQTTAGLAANVATLAANSASFLGNSSGTIANVASWITGNSATAYSNATSYADLAAANAYANAVANAAALYQTTAGLSANVATLTANNSTNLNGQPASFYTNATNLATGTVPTARLGSGTANSTTFLSGDQSYKTAVTSVASGNGLSGGPITATGTLSVQANDGITSNASGVFVRAGTGVTVNATGVHIGQAVGTTSGVTFGTLSVTGNAALGDATADIVSINGSVNTNIMPSANVTYGLGNSTVRWSQVHVANVHAVTGKFDGNVEIGGNLILTGNVSNVSVTDLIVSDPLIHIGANNEVSDLVDLGWVGHYSDDGGTTKRHAGLFRDATDGTFKLFRNLVQADLDTANALTINTAAASYSTATLQTFLSSGALTSNTTAVTITANSTVNVAIVANTVTAGLFTGNVTGTASNATNLNNQPASFYTNATNISTGTLDNARLPANVSVTVVNAVTLSVGTAVVANSGGLTTSGNVTIGSAGDLVLQSGAGIVANGSLGSNGQILFSNGSSVYWSNAAGSSSAVVSQQFTANGTANSFTISGGYLPGAIEVYVAGVKQTPGTDVVISSGSTVDLAVAPLTGQIVDVFGFVGVGSIVTTGTVTSVASGAGLTGGPITNSGTLSVQANNGVTANSTGLFVTQGTGAVVNATGVHVNASYIATISANNASFLGGTAAASYQLNSTLAANVATLAANSATFANSSATNTFTVGAASYFVANGNFGIGTASPATLLDVNGRVTLRNDRILQIADGSTYEIGPSAGSGNTAVWGLFAPAGRATALFSNAVERIRIDTNGNVGVGNIAPDARLTVTGAANVSGNVVIGGTLNSGNVTASLFTGNVTGTASNATNLNSQPGSFYTNATNLATGTVPTARLGSGTANSTTFLGGDQTYKTAVTSVATGSGLTGGTVTTTGTVSVLANNGITANATGVYVTQGTGTVVNATGVHVNSAYIATIAANSATGSLTNTFTVGTAAYFVANGNVGIGTSSPESGFKLHVVGDAFVQSAGQTIAKTVVDSGDNRLVLGSYFETFFGQHSFISSTNNAETGNSPLLFFTGTTERVRITADGNVGIGDGAPDARLTVTGTANVSGNAVIGGSLSAANVTATVFTGNLTGTANNATNLNSQPASFYTNATNLATGTVPTARLGSGTPNSTTFLRGDQTWATVSGGVNTAAQYSWTNTHSFAANVTITSLTVSGRLSDSTGNVRDVPVFTQSAVYTIANTDAGETLSTTANVTVNAAVLYAGFIVSIYNNSASSFTIIPGTGTTMHLAGTANTSNRTLGQRGICTVHCVAANTVVISGAGLS